MLPPYRTVPEITPRELHARRASHEPLLLLDVREPWEWEVAHLDGAQLMPLATFARESETLSPTNEIVVYCHHGVRSLAAAQFLAARGFAAVSNLAGGIDRYSCDVDPRIPRY